MKLIAVSVMRNEGDVVEVFVRHHAEFVDELIIVDHKSCDATGEILRELKAEGLPLVLHHEDTNAFHQAVITTRSVREAAIGRSADWVLPLDADEFLTSDSDPRVRPVIEALRTDSVFRVPWRTYVPQLDDKPDEPHLHIRIPHRRRDEGLVHGKVVIPGELVRNQKLKVSVGSHHVRVRRRFKDRRVKSVPAEDLVLAHFPVRSASQITLRAVAGWPTRLAAGMSEEKHWGLYAMFRRVAGGEVFRSEDLPGLAALYAQRQSDVEPTAAAAAVVEDPVISPGDYVLTRPGEPAARPQIIFAQMLEQFGEEIARRSR